MPILPLPLTQPNAKALSEGRDLDFPFGDDLVTFTERSRGGSPAHIRKATALVLTLTQAVSDPDSDYSEVTLLRGNPNPTPRATTKAGRLLGM